MERSLVNADHSLCSDVSQLYNQKLQMAELEVVQSLWKTWFFVTSLWALGCCWNDL